MRWEGGELASLAAAGCRLRAAMGERVSLRYEKKLRWLGFAAFSFSHRDRLQPAACSL
mgnify:CR=1 FL=1